MYASDLMYLQNKACLCLSSVLNSQRAIDVNVAIMRAFVRLRNMVVSNEQMSRQLHLVEKKLERHDKRFKKHSRQIRIVFNAIYEMMNSPKAEIGFRAV